jgi:hypothetical protein
MDCGENNVRPSRGENIAGSGRFHSGGAVIGGVVCGYLDSSLSSKLRTLTFAGRHDDIYKVIKLVHQETLFSHHAA